MGRALVLQVTRRPSSVDETLLHEPMRATPAERLDAFERWYASTRDHRLLDAARECVLAVGVRRTTMTDVARRAGVSRMTLYRRFPDLEGVLAAPMTRELGRLVAQAAGATARERAVAMVVHGARSLANDPLFVRLLDVDPELLLPYVTRRLGGMQTIAVAAGAEALGVGDGSVRTDAPPEVLSAGIELIARGFVLASHGELAVDPWGRAGARGGLVPAAMSASLNEARRRAELERLAGGEEVDVVVVGGGITGAGVALDAASAGCRSRCSSAATSRTARAAGARSSCTAGCATSSRATWASRGVGGRAVDGLTGAPFTVRARHTVVAAGVWTGGLTEAVSLRPSRGSHVLVRAERLGHPCAVVNVRVPGGRGRWVSAIPRSDVLVVIGLTDVPAPGAPADEPRPDPAEEAELLENASAALDALLRAGDVVGRYAGLRPLAAGDGDETADLSRRHAIVEDPGSGALAIVGGKLTAYRRMAQDAVDRLTVRPCRTHRLPVVGAAPPAALRSVAAPERLVRRYGTEAPAVVALADGRELLEPVAPGVPVCAAELLWAARHELALTVDDFADRRTRAGLVPEWRAATVAAVERLDSVPAA